MQAEVREINEANGWYDADRTFGDEIALLHSEVSEMLEAFRSWGLRDATERREFDTVTVHVMDGSGKLTLPKPEGVGSEAADVFIRLLDLCERHGIDLRAEYVRKAAYNRTRGYKHGGKSL